MNAAVYCRVSSELQETEGTSLDSQLEQCQKKAKELGYEISEQYTIRETYSGRTLDRPQLAKVRGWLDTREIDALIIYSSDRFSRDGYDFLTLIRDCQKAGVRLLCVTEPLENGPVGELLSYLRGWASGLEADRTRERTLRGKRERIKNGKLPTGRGVIYGYDYDKDTGLNVANDDLDTVRIIGRWIIEEGIFLNEACRRLMQTRIPAPKGGHRWSRGTVGRIMRNPTYAGRSYACKTRTEGKKRVSCPETDHVLIPNAVDKPAFTWEEWEMIQRQLDRNKELSPRNQKLSYLLSGRIVCKSCGRKYYGVPMHGKPYYRCSGRIGLLSDKRCTSKIINARQLDEVVWTEVAAALKDPGTILAGLQQLRDGINQEGFWKEELDRIAKKLKAMDVEQEQLLQWAKKGFPEDLVVRDNQKINRKRTELQRELKETKTKLRRAGESHIDLQNVERFCEITSLNLADFGYAEKKLALEALMVRVWIDGKTAHLDGVLPIPGEVHAMSQPL